MVPRLRKALWAPPLAAVALTIGMQAMASELDDAIEKQFPSYYRDIVGIARAIWVPWCHPVHILLQPGDVRITECDGGCIIPGWWCECWPGEATCGGWRDCKCI